MQTLTDPATHRREGWSSESAKQLEEEDLQPQATSARNTREHLARASLLPVQTLTQHGLNRECRAWSENSQRACKISALDLAELNRYAMLRRHCRPDLRWWAEGV